MFNPAEYMLQTQKTMMTATTACFGLGASYYLRSLVEMQRLWAGMPHRRDEDQPVEMPKRIAIKAAPHKPCLAKGPQLDDHYGHRAHDVDLERI